MQKQNKTNLKKIKRYYLMLKFHFIKFRSFKIRPTNNNNILKYKMDFGFMRQKCNYIINKLLTL